jgi:hypothetical protein
MKLHIGKEIESRYKESGIKLSEFAKRLSTSPRNVYAIFDRPDIKTDLLKKIGEVLRFNFFSLYTESTGIRDVEEPGLHYLKLSPKSNTISLIVTLDGEEKTLNQWIERLSVINKTIS